MANQWQLELLKQSIAGWNRFREHQREIELQARDFDWSEATAPGDFATDVDLGGADLSGADLSGADLSKVGYGKADLRGANLSGADLKGAKLYGAGLNNADLSDADLSDADLSDADLSDADLSRATLSRVDITGAKVGGTHFDDVDLRTVKGLEGLNHKRASHISITTLYRSEGQIPESFLRKAGVPEDFITYIHSLVNHPIKYYTCFISYSSKDQAFAERLYTDLQQKGVRCWFAPHDLKTGDRYRDRIEESIRVYDKLMLILSKNAVASTWVEEEVEKAMDKERQLRAQGRKQTVLFPIKLDDTVMQTTKAWAADVRRLWHIGDFIGWHDYACYQRAFTRLLRDLKSEASHSHS